MKFCTNCGNQIVQQNKFCTSCGHALSHPEVRESSLAEPHQLDPKNGSASATIPVDANLTAPSPVDTPKANQPYISNLETEKLLANLHSKPKRKVGIGSIAAFGVLILVAFIVNDRLQNPPETSNVSSSVSILDRLNSNLPSESSDKWELDVANQLTGVPSIAVYLCGTGAAIWIYSSLDVAQSSIDQGDWIYSKDSTLYLGIDSSKTYFGVILASQGNDTDCERSANDTFNSTNSFKAVSAVPTEGQAVPTQPIAPSADPSIDAQTPSVPSTTDVIRFMSPKKNIFCEWDEAQSYVRCDFETYNGTENLPDASECVTWSGYYSFIIPTNGPAFMTCFGETIIDRSWDTLPYDTEAQLDNITCVLDTKELFCKNEQGNELHANRNRYSVS